MKCYMFITALVLVVAQVKSDHREDLRKFDLACREESHVSETDVQTFFKSDMKEEPKEDLKCHMKCVMEKQGYWKDGAFDAENAIQQIQNIPDLKHQQAEITEIVNGCKDQKGANECGTAYLITKCIFDRHNHKTL